MSGTDWHQCKFLESAENLKPLVKRRFGREPSSSIAREIAACLQQGRLFYEAAASSPLEIRPLQLFYGMAGFSKALVLARHVRSLSTLRPAHGLKDISTGNARISELRVRIEHGGTFHEFNDVVSELNRVCYIDSSTKSHAIALPSAKSEQICGIELSVRDILSRIPGLESLYRMTFGEDAHTQRMMISPEFGDDEHYSIQIVVSEVFSNPQTLRRIVDRLRGKFPFLDAWQLHTAERAWDSSYITFRNIRRSDIDEFSETRLFEQGRGFLVTDSPGEQLVPFSLREGLNPLAGGYTGRCCAVCSLNGHYLSEFSFHYMALFLLSSLVRYRPQTWMHSISRSVTPEVPADDQVLSLIERFLDLNSSEIPTMAITVLNPIEDRYA